MIESPEDRRRLLSVARETASRVLGGGAPARAGGRPVIPGRFGGAFVTFWSGKTLRGCVGVFDPTADIVGTIEQVTEASLGDVRFQDDPISATELDSLQIEISILSDLWLTDDPSSLVPGTHGVVVRRGHRSGCFLPQVAAERGWSAEEFLSNCCSMKAGISGDAWRRVGTEVLLFTADVFSESDFA